MQGTTLGIYANDISHTIGILVAVAAAIGLCLRGRTKPEPPEEDLPGVVRQVSTLIVAVALALFLTQWVGMTYRPLHVSLVIASTAGCLGAFLSYVSLISIHTFPLAGKRRIGGSGFGLCEPLPAGIHLKDRLKELQDPDKVWTPRSRAAMKACFILAYLAFTVLGSIALVSAATLQPVPLPAGRIIFPLDEAVLEQGPQTIKVSMTSLPPDSSVWILVYDTSSGTYCPQQRVDLPLSGQGVVHVPIGVEREESEKRFDVLAVSADKTATAVFNAYIRKEGVTPTFPGLELPPGALILDRITVVRK